MQRIVGLLGEVAERAKAVGRPALACLVVDDPVVGLVLPVGGRSMRRSDMEDVARLIGNSSMVDAQHITERHIIDIAQSILPEIEQIPEMLELACALRSALARPPDEVARLWKVHIGG